MKRISGWKLLLSFAVVGFATYFFAACGSSNNCTPTSCPNGCCNAGTCVAGTSSNACGKGGVTCQLCGSSQTCSAQQICAASGGCTAASCPTGCCDSTGTCQTAESISNCGSGGA